MCFDVWTWHWYPFRMVLMWYMNLDHIFRNWREREKRKRRTRYHNAIEWSKRNRSTGRQIFRTELSNRTAQGTCKEQGRERESPVNERKINDRIAENSGRKTVFPISFGISCSWNWQSLALCHTLTFSLSVSSDRHEWFFVQQVTVNWFILWLSSSAFLSLFLSFASLLIADDVAVVIVYDDWLQDIEARSIFHFFAALALSKSTGVLAQSLHYILILWSALTSHILLFFTSQTMCAVFCCHCCCCHIREYRLIFIAIRAPSANLHIHTLL